MYFLLQSILFLHNLYTVTDGLRLTSHVYATRVYYEFYHFCNYINFLVTTNFWSTCSFDIINSTRCYKLMKKFPQLSPRYRTISVTHIEHPFRFMEIISTFTNYDNRCNFVNRLRSILLRLIRKYFS